MIEILTHPAIVTALIIAFGLIGFRVLAEWQEQRDRRS